MKRVHVVFKTHLDVGFTDLADTVVRHYMEDFIPRAMDLAETLDSGDGKPRFIWTTGSWLISKYLRESGSAGRERMIEAINRGHIAWHALPFTTHSELVSPDLFSFGLSISEGLDRQFGKKTIAAKMSDVPGHTRGIVSILAQHDVRYLHIGVNPASKVPSVPVFFRWRDAGGAEVIVNYSHGYGDVAELPGSDEILVVSYTNDNLGPPTREAILKTYETLEERFPDAEVCASTLDRFAEGALSVRELLPIVEEEIGDTWIHGVATDPSKVARLRELLRLRSKWAAEGKIDSASEEMFNFSENLLLVAEHTWGVDVKTHLSDNGHYANQEFAKVRGGKAYRFCEASWTEQRHYTDLALASLAPNLAKEATRAVETLVPVRPDIHTGSEIAAGEEYTVAGGLVTFGDDGGILRFADRAGHVWASPHSRLALFRYERFGAQEVTRWCEQYLEINPEDRVWAHADFGKPGLENLSAGPTHELAAPSGATMRLLRTPDADTVVVVARLREELHTDHGAPREVVLTYTFPRSNESSSSATIDLSLSWFEKTASRLPEASWFTFSPLVANPYRWTFTKLGEQISPFDVVANGNRALHAVDGSVRYRGADGQIEIVSLDAPLVAPGAPRLLTFENTFADPSGGMHFLLHNNVWGTNFPQWYEEDARFRFTILLNAPEV